MAQPEGDRPQIGDTTNRIVVVASGLLPLTAAGFALSIAEYAWAAGLGATALLVLVIGAAGSRRKVAAAKKVADTFGAFPGGN